MEVGTVVRHVWQENAIMIVSRGFAAGNSDNSSLEMSGAAAILGSSIFKFIPYDTSFAIHKIVVYILHVMGTCSGKFDEVVIVRPLQEYNYRIIEVLNTLIWLTPLLASIKCSVSSS